MASYEAPDGSRVDARIGSHVDAWTGSHVDAWGGSRVDAMGGSIVNAWDGSIVTAWSGSAVTAWSGSAVTAWDSSTVNAWDGSIVHAWYGSTVRVHSGAQIEMIDANGDAIGEPATMVEQADVEPTVADLLDGIEVALLEADTLARQARRTIAAGDGDHATADDVITMLTDLFRWFDWSKATIHTTRQSLNPAMPEGMEAQ